MAPQKSQHFTDNLLVGKRVRRKISNWLNYREPGRDWSESDPTVEQAVSIPDNWEGNFDFKYQSLRGPIQAFVGDSTDLINTALVGLRRADRPECWINYKALGVNGSVEMEVFPAQKAVRWKDLWNNANLGYRVGRHKLEKQISLKAPGHPVSFRFAFRIPSGMSYEITSNQLVLRDENGVVVLRTQPPFGWDSSTTVLTPDGKQYIRVTMVESNPVTYKGKTFPTLTITPNLDDLASAVYPVEIDPTTKIEGTTDIEDASMQSNYPFYNYGGGVSLYLYKDSFDSNCIMRVMKDAIPSGSITGFRVYWFAYLFGPVSNIEAYIIKDANDWVEGTATAGAEVGSCCWSQAKYQVQDWAGEPIKGCAASGSDYDADGSPPSVLLDIHGAWYEFTLKTEWPLAWRDEVRLTNGLVFIPSTVGAQCVVRSTEYSSYQPYFEIDWEPAGGIAQRFFFLGR